MCTFNFCNLTEFLCILLCFPHLLPAPKSQLWKQFVCSIQNQWGRRGREGAASEAAGGRLSRGRKRRAMRLVCSTNGQTGVGGGSDSRSASHPPSLPVFGWRAVMALSIRKKRARASNPFYWGGNMRCRVSVDVSSFSACICTTRLLLERHSQQQHFLWITLQCAENWHLIFFCINIQVGGGRDF